MPRYAIKLKRTADSFLASFELDAADQGAAETAAAAMAAAGGGGFDTPEVALDAITIISALKLDDLAAPEDNTDLNATTSAHGLCPKFPGGTATFLRADNTWAAPTAAAADPVYAAGSFTVSTGTGKVQPKRLELSAAQRATLEGTARLVMCG